MLWVIVGYGFLVANNNPRKKGSFILWVMWVIVPGILNRRWPSA
jgi:hypothetical protein